jgi:hypothetical protein
VACVRIRGVRSTACAPAEVLTKDKGPDERDIARARPDKGVPDQQAAPHVPLGVGEPMGRAVGTEQARLRQGPASRRSVFTLRVRVAYIGAKFGSATMTWWPSASRQRANPFAVGRGFDHNPGTGPGPEHGGEALRLGANPLLDDLTPIGEDVDQYGPWRASPLCGVDRAVLLSGSSCHHVKREASRFIHLRSQ